MDAKLFEQALRQDGFDEVQTRELPANTVNAEHEHPFDVRALVLDGEITLTVEGAPRAYHAGEVFTMAAGCRHVENVGPVGVRYLAGRKHARSA